MSGFEIVGLVLGILPIFLDIAKDERGRINTVLSAVSKQKEAEEREEFYEEFHFQTLRLKLSFRTVVNNLALPEAHREILLSTMEADGDSKAWAENPEAYKALVSLFGGESEWKAIEVLLNKVYRLFERVLKDKTIRLLPNDQSQEKMYDKLLEFQKQHQLGRHKTKFSDRLKFLQRRKDREVCLRNLEKWNKRFDHTIKTVCSNHADLKRNAHSIIMSSYVSPGLYDGNLNTLAGGTGSRTSFTSSGNSFKDSDTGTLSEVTGTNTGSLNSKIPSSTKRFRGLSKQLFAAFSTYWTCDCPTQHEARFCLADCVDNCQSNSSTTVSGLVMNDHGAKNDTDSESRAKTSLQPNPDSISFNFFLQIISKADHSNHQDGSWYEGTVDFTSSPVTNKRNNGGKNSQHDAVDTQICKEFSTQVPARNSSYIRLLMNVEDDGGSKLLVDWKLQTRKTKHRLTLEDMRESALPLDSCLRQFKSPSRLQKRKLALIFAYSLFQLYESSQLLNSDWDKQHIYFFRKPGATLDVLDMDHPYLRASSRSNHPSNHCEKGDVRTGTMFHRSPGVFKLGLLLIEIHLWKCIEELRVADDIDPSGQNTDLYAAFRLVEESLSNDCDAGYRAIVENCLNVPWYKTADSTEVQEEAIWEGVYKDIIQPLEQELNSGVKKSTKDYQCY